MRRYAPTATSATKRAANDLSVQIGMLSAALLGTVGCCLRTSGFTTFRLQVLMIKTCSNVTSLQCLPAWLQEQYIIIGFGHIIPENKHNVRNVRHNHHTAKRAVSTTGLTAIIIFGSQIVLSGLDASNNEDGFKVEEKQVPVVHMRIIATLGANVQSYSQHWGLAELTSYY